MRELKIYLPRNLVSFQVTKEEAEKVTRMCERTKRKWNKSVIKIREAAKIYKWAIDLLENAKDSSPIHAVAIPLCL